MKKMYRRYMLRRRKIKQMPSKQRIISLKQCGCRAAENMRWADSDSGADNTNNEIITGIWTPDRLITSFEELYAVISEPLFITGKNSWLEKEILANTLELGMCAHFMRKLNHDYIYQFIQSLIQEKQRYLERNQIAFPVTFYLWHYYGHDRGGQPFLCFNFVSGEYSALPFGKKTINNSLPTIIRKFLKLKDTKFAKCLDAFAQCISLKNETTKPISSLSESEAEELYQNYLNASSSFQDRALPQNILK